MKRGGPSEKGEGRGGEFKSTREEGKNLFLFLEGASEAGARPPPPKANESHGKITAHSSSMSRGSARNYGPHARSVGSPVLATVPATEAGRERTPQGAGKQGGAVGDNHQKRASFFDVCLSRPTKKERERRTRGDDPSRSKKPTRSRCFPALERAFQRRASLSRCISRPHAQEGHERRGGRWPDRARQTHRKTQAISVSSSAHCPRVPLSTLSLSLFLTLQLWHDHDKDASREQWANGG